MNETIDLNLVYAKTPKGVAEINARSGAISLQTRRVLIMIDGHRPVSELTAVVRTGEFEGTMATLEAQGMIEKVDPTLLAPRDYEEEDFADTISLLQENAAALRSLPNVHPASLAHEATTAMKSRPDTIGSEAPVTVAPADAAALAVRAVAAASAPQPAEAAQRRPPTLTGAGPATLSGNVSALRTGTLSGSARVPDPASRPPTLTGQRPAPATVRTVAEVPVRTQAAVQEPVSVRAQVAAAVAAPAAAPTAPAAPATVRTVAEVAVRTSVAAPEPAAARAQPAAAAAPAPAASAPAARTLEEEKRYAVSELYSILGPYGEQPAAKIQECTSTDALREQIKQAGRRIATFRGEKAAQEYLRTVGHA